MQASSDVVTPSKRFRAPHERPGARNPDVGDRSQGRGTGNEPFMGARRLGCEHASDGLIKDTEQFRPTSGPSQSQILRRTAPFRNPFSDRVKGGMLRVVRKADAVVT
jgi:hypothetical protein